MHGTESLQESMPCSSCGNDLEESGKEGGKQWQWEEAVEGGLVFVRAGR